MLCRPALLGAVAMLAAATAAARADTRTFVIANSPDGYGVDQCLAEGASCGNAVAAAYCRSKDYEEAISFRRVAAEEAAAASPVVENANWGAQRDSFVAIACSR